MEVPESPVQYTRQSSLGSGGLGGRGSIESYGSSGGRGSTDSTHGDEFERLTATASGLVQLCQGFNSNGRQDPDGRRGLPAWAILPTEFLGRPTTLGRMTREQRLAKEQEFVEFLETELQYRGALPVKQTAELLEDVTRTRNENLRHKEAIREMRQELSSSQHKEMQLDEELEIARNARKGDGDTHRRDFSHLEAILDSDERKKASRDTPAEEEAELGSLRRENEQLRGFLRNLHNNLRANEGMFAK